MWRCEYAQYSNRRFIIELHMRWKGTEFLQECKLHRYLLISMIISYFITNNLNYEIQKRALIEKLFRFITIKFLKLTLPVKFLAYLIAPPLTDCPWTARIAQICTFQGYLKLQSHDFFSYVKSQYSILTNNWKI